MAPTAASVTIADFIDRATAEAEAPHPVLGMAERAVVNSIKRHQSPVLAPAVLSGSALHGLGRGDD